MTSMSLTCWTPFGESLGVRTVDVSGALPIVGDPAEGPEEGHLVPGFVDLHIHGGFGIDFMTASKAALSELSSRLAAEGYDAWLPTTITASAEDVAKALESLPENDPRIEGFHLEGPFISPAFPGAQPPQSILPPSSSSSGAWQKVLTDSRLRVATLAPEEPGGLELVAELASRGIRPSMGHTNATYEEALLGFDAGVCQATHTFNAMRGLHHREPGTVGAILGDERVVAELIYDRVHVHPGAAKALLAAKGSQGVIAVSDGTMAAGMPPGTEFEVWGHKMVTSEGDVRLKSNGALAGSAITLRHAFENLAEDFGIKTAVMLCSANPRKALGLARPPRTWALFNPWFRFVRAWSC
jgi:N-acetylglucosamine-6-phosphate deacetylase